MAPKQLPAVLLAACATLLALAAPLLAGDPDMLQDVCVADYKSLGGPLRLNGFPCKRPENVTADDFFSAALALPGNTGAPAAAISAFNSQLPGTQSLALAMFAASPPVPTDVLARALQIDGGLVEAIKSKFPPK
uniref:Uncharacterized protein n=1 Tax=Aegilops tauschii TaxID=37682 RepID=M8BDD3_AEGTA